MSIELIIFDLDGTLVDSIRDITNALNHVIRPLSAITLSPAEVTGMVGEGAHKLVGKALEKCRLTSPIEPLVTRYTERYASHLTDCTSLYPHVQEALARLAGYRMALVSNKPELLSRRILESFGLLKYFEAIVCADTIAQRKPSPEPLLHVLSVLGVAVTRAVMVGDSGIDIEAGKACSMRTIALTHGYGKPGFQEEADFVIDGLLPLVELVKSLP